MKSDPDKFLNQLVVAALTAFIIVVMLLAALVIRHIRFQQHLTELTSEVQVSLSDLEEITEEIERELVDIRTTTDDAQSLDNWEDMTAVLDDVGEQLDSIEGDLSDVAMVLEQPADAPPTLTGGDAPPQLTVQDEVDQIFTVFTTLVSLASIAIALLLGMAVRVQQSEA